MMINKVKRTTGPTGIYDLPASLDRNFEMITCKGRMPDAMLEMSEGARFGDDLDPFEDPNMISPN